MALIYQEFPLGIIETINIILLGMVSYLTHKQWKQYAVVISEHAVTTGSYTRMWLKYYYIVGEGEEKMNDVTNMICGVHYEPQCVVKVIHLSSHSAPFLFCFSFCLSYLCQAKFTVPTLFCLTDCWVWALQARCLTAAEQIHHFKSFIPIATPFHVDFNLRTVDLCIIAGLVC